MEADGSQFLRYSRMLRIEGINEVGLATKHGPSSAPAGAVMKATAPPLPLAQAIPPQRGGDIVVAFMGKTLEFPRRPPSQARTTAGRGGSCAALGPCYWPSSGPPSS